jgi:hypothetical protein
MRIVDPGHTYALQILDNDGPATALRLVFVKREGPKFPGNDGHYSGTNLQEVLRACRDRLLYLNHQEHDYRNEIIIDHLMNAVYLLEERAAERHGRIPLGRVAAIYGDTCEKCGHVGCGGSCHH